MKSVNETMTRSMVQCDEVAALLRARNPLLWIVTKEEGRVESLLFETAASVKTIMRTWDVAAGLCDFGGAAFRTGTEDPGDALNTITQFARSGNERCMWVMRDLPTWLTGQPNASTLRRLRNLVNALPRVSRESAQTIVVLSPVGQVPEEIASLTTLIDWPLPDREEIADLLDAAIVKLPPELRANAAPNGKRDAAIDGGSGLTADEIAALYAKSLVQHRCIEPSEIAKEKRKLVAKEKVIEPFEPIPGGLDAVGGCGELRSYIRTRKVAFSAEARAYGLPRPKAILLIGQNGCGKSRTAKATASEFDCPGFKLDLNALKSKFVGESEGNIRKATRVIDATGRVVIWIDELDKALQGAVNAAADGGVSADAVGTFLTWSEEREGEAFIIATANDIESIAEKYPELLRRFDEIFFVDLPTTVERREIAAVALRENKRDPEDFDLDAVAEATAEYTGAEIAGCVREGLYIAFFDGKRDIETRDLVAAAKKVIPISKTAKEKMERLRKWAAEGRAKFATAPDVVAASKKRSVGAGMLDIDVR